MSGFRKQMAEDRKQKPSRVLLLIIFLLWVFRHLTSDS
jgi:hypothetical protein